MEKFKKKFTVASPYFSDLDIKFIQSKIKSILKGKLSTGPYTKEFERKFANFVGSKYAVFLNTCTSALEISIQSLKLKKNDEVIVPVQSFIADGTCVTNVNAKVIFAEVDENNFCINLDEIKSKTTKNTKAVILVYFGGYSPEDLKQIKSYCVKKNIKLIEDCAHSIGGSVHNLKLGSVGYSGCYSFFSTKTITTGEGGMLTTNDRYLYDFALSMRERGRDWRKKKELYVHEGRNCRVPEISAILGLSQLSNLKKFIKHRNKIVDIYDRALLNNQYVKTLKKNKNSKYSIWKHVSIIKNQKISRIKLQKYLIKNYNIFINWAYDPPLHLQPFFIKKYKIKKGFLEKTENLMSKHFHLPLHPLINVKDAKFIVKSLIKSLKEI